MILLILLASLQAHADSLEVIGGSLTYHILGSQSESFSNKVSSDGRLIDNPLFGGLYTIEDKEYYESIAVFAGDNSVGKPIIGAKAAKGLKVGNWYAGFVLGAYEQDTTEFDNRGIVPFQIGKIGTTGIVPIIGVELNYKIALDRYMFIRINNIISPVLTNTTLSLGVSY